MDPDHLEELISIERGYWWHVAKRALVTEILVRHAPPPGTLVEGGIGGGANLEAFRGLGYRVIGFDDLPAAVHHCRDRGLEEVRVHDLQAPWPVEPGSARAVILLDVLEHLDDPVTALRHACVALAGGGVVVATVPALPFLIGPWDRMLGHRRRYTPALLRDHGRAAGLRTVWWSYWNAFTLPAAILVRLVEKWRSHARSSEFPPVSRIVNSLLITCGRIERLWMRRRPVPVGLSLVGVMMP